MRKFLNILLLIISFQIFASHPSSLVFPKHNMILSEDEVTFEWNIFENFTGEYKLQISHDPNFVNNVIEYETNENFLTVALNYSWEPYFWRVKPNGSENSNWTNTSSFYIFSPLLIPDLEIWLDPGYGVSIDGNDRVIEWLDRANNNNAVQNNPANRPLLRFNDTLGSPSFYYNRNHFLEGSAEFGNLTEYSFISLVTPLEFANHRWIFHNAPVGTDFSFSLSVGSTNNFRFWPQGGSNVFNFNISAGNKPYVISFLNNNSLATNKTRFFQNKTSAGSSNSLTSTHSNPGYLIGRWGGGTHYFKGEITEILLYSRELNNQERESIENYLLHKYAPPVNLGFDVIVEYGFCPVEIDAGNYFESYLWSTGETNPSIFVNTSGKYKVTVTDIFGFQSIDSVLVKFPDVHLNEAQTLICAGDTIELYSTVENPELYSFLWNTGDTSQNLMVFDAGNYWVEIIDNEGCSILSDTVVVSVDNFSDNVSLGNDLEICSGNTLSLQWPPNNDSYSYQWSTEDTTPEIIITESGNYSVSVTNENGCVGEDEIYVEVIGFAPQTVFTATTSCLGDSTYFQDLSEVLDESTIIEWAWDFGDGNFSFQQNPVHLYDSPGSYIVNLTTTTSSTCSNSVSLPVEVNDTAQVFFSNRLACINTPIAFENLSTIPESTTAISWLWDFGDGAQNATQNPVHQYENPGYYEVSLEVILDNDCVNQFTAILEVLETAPEPEAFTVYLPKNNQNFTPQESISFKWNESVNAFGYLLQIALDENFENIILDTDIISENEYNVMLESGFYYSRISAFDLCLGLHPAEFVNISVFDPGQINDLVFWFDSDSIELVNNKVAVWYDKSGNENHASQTNEANRPVYLESESEIAGKPSLGFQNNQEQYLAGNAMVGNFEEYSLFVLTRADQFTNHRWVYKNAPVSVNESFSVSASGNNNFRFWPQGGSATGMTDFGQESQIQKYYILSVNNDNSLIPRANLYKNGLLTGSVNTPTSLHDTPGFTIGRFSTGASSHYFSGAIAELLLIDRKIPDEERIQIEKYFRFKYSPPITLGPDRNTTYGFCPVVLDAGERFESYLWSTGEVTQTIEVNTPGVYGVTVTDIFGFQSSDSLEVRFPEMGLNTTEITLCEGESTSLEFISGFTEHISLLWSTGDTTPAIEVDQPGIYTLQLTDSLGCSINLNAEVIVDYFESTATLGDPRPFCMGDTLFLQSEWLPYELSYIWNDGSTGIGLVISEPGSYSVTATNPNGCVASSSTTLSFQGYAPDAGFETTSVCFGEPTTFLDTSQVEDSEIISRFWYFNDPNDFQASDSGTEVDYIYSQAGIFNATLEVESAAGCARSISQPVQVYHLPESWFTPNNACTDISVSFQDASTDMEGGIGQWQWRFFDSDGNLAGQSTDSSPEFTFEIPGTSHVELTTTSIVGCSDTIVRSINVRESPAVDFDFTTPCLGDPVFFTDLTQAPPWALVTSQYWDFGDGSFSSQTNPSHLYQQAGVFDVTLNVTAINGCQPALTRQVIVHSPPEADFAAPDLCENTAHTFTDMSTVENSVITEWLWDFAGQGQSNEQFPQWVFTEPGQYDVSLTAISEAGCQGSITQPVDVFPAPRPDFSFFPRFGVAPLTVSFTNLSEGASLYSWDFGDGSPPNEQANPTHTFTENGIYLTQLTAFTELGCADVATQEIKVIPLSIDIAVTDLGYKVQNNLLEVNARLMNMGTLEFDTLFLTYHLSGRDPIRETWTGLLRPGKSTTYTFNAQLPWRESYTHFCVEAFIPRVDKDDNPDNNRMCLSFVDEFRLLPAFPNPAEGFVNIGFILPYSDRVTVTLSNIHGHALGTIYEGTPEQGISLFRIPIEHLSNGIYFYRVVFREEIKVGRFMKY
ncbi:MAG: PKD domain-containing protein [Bacteroidetes bacterium]|nr:MAG: PKD domain-containing protein [Bacteroidota bacterium]